MGAILDESKQFLRGYLTIFDNNAQYASFASKYVEPKIPEAVQKYKMGKFPWI